MRFLYQMSLVLMSVLSLVICTYIADSVFAWLNPSGNVYAVQLMPEAKVLSQKLSPDHMNVQPFALNYLCITVGFSLVLAFCIFYLIVSNICLGSEPSFYSKAVCLRSLVVLTFFFVAVMSYLKPYVHMNPHFKINVDWSALHQKFTAIQPMTNDYGLVLGILAFNVSVQQLAIVTNKMQEAAVESKETRRAPYKESF